MNSATHGTLRLESLEAREVPAAATPRMFATGAGEGGGPQVNVYNDTGFLVRSFFAYDPGFRGGVRVATGDVTGDGWDDVVTGAGPGGGPHVKVFDGISGAEVRSFFAFDAGSTAGVKVAVGNVNAAGTADVIASGVEFGVSRVKVFENGNPAANYFSVTLSNVGVYNVAATDYDGDGFKDVLLGTPNAAATVDDVAVYSYRRPLIGLPSKYIAFGLGAVGQVSVAGGNLDYSGSDELGYGFSTGGSSVVSVRSWGSAALNYDLFNPVSGWTGEVRVAFGDYRTPVLGGTVMTGVGPGGGPVLNVRDAHNPGWVLKNEFVYDPSFRGGIYVG
jgi:hypothetical protein